MTRQHPIWLILGLTAFFLAADPLLAQTPTDAQVEETIQRLIKEIKEEGAEWGWEKTAPPSQSEMATPPDGLGKFSSWRTKTANYGGATALAVTALLTAGVDARADEQLSKAIEWLCNFELVGNYATSFRLQAFSRLLDDRPTLRAVMVKDVAHEAQAQLANGNWWYVPTADKTRDGTNSNGQLAVLGLWSAAQAGVSVPAKVWQNVEKHWLDGQHQDGGWGYQPRTRPDSYGAMTASGVATLYILLEQLHGDMFVGLRGGKTADPLKNGLAWLGKNFVPDANPGYGQDRGGDSDRSHWAYWLYSVERAGQAGGFKYLPGGGDKKIDWFKEGAGQFVREAKERRGLNFEEKCFALMFLAKGNAPTFVHKLEWDGDWNQRPHDLLVACRYIDKLFERRVNWYSVTLDTPPAELLEAPVLYVSGTQELKLTPAQSANLKAYLDGGGFLLAEPTGGKTGMIRPLRTILSDMYPKGDWQKLTADHPLLSAYVKAAKPVPGEVFKVEGKTLALLSGVDLSRPLQISARASNKEVFDLVANCYTWLVKQGKIKRKLSIVGPGQVVGVNITRPAVGQTTPAPTTQVNVPDAGPKPDPTSASQPASAGGAVLDVKDAEGIQKALADGQEVSVQGAVKKADWSAKGTVLRIHFEGAETSKFHVVIFGKERDKFDAAFGGDVAKALAGAVIRVKGKVAEYRGDPQIAVQDPAQITKVK